MHINLNKTEHVTKNANEVECYSKFNLRIDNWVTNMYKKNIQKQKLVVSNQSQNHEI